MIEKIEWAREEIHSPLKKKKENLLRLTTESERIWEEKKSEQEMCIFIYLDLFIR